MNQNIDDSEKKVAAKFQELSLRLPSVSSDDHTQTPECSICLRDFQTNELAHFSACRHSYCKQCARRVVGYALKGFRFPAKCCERPIKLGVDLETFLPAETITRYEKQKEEFCQKTKRYCSRAVCSAFLPSSDNYKDGMATCPVCLARTCTRCMSKTHRGQCKKDDDDQRKFLELAKRSGWQKCLRCGEVVEKISGCLHMKCVCYAQWCYNCGVEWDTCDCEDDEED